MIVAKFGGTSVADADRIRAVATIVRGLRAREPVVVVVSALAGVTDLLVAAVESAGSGDLEGLEPILADLERRHRWAVAGGIEDAARRHGLDLQLGGLFEDLRQRLRSMRILGEVTPRARDAILAFGEDLSSRIVAAVFEDQGLAAAWVDARRVVLTDSTHGAAAPDPAAVRRAARLCLPPAAADGAIPVLGGFVGATADGETTTLGRGGSDTTACVLGAALEVREIQIWTDVDGLMSADPRRVPEARRLPEVSFEEAAELSVFGARVLHPPSVIWAVQADIPVRVLNSMRAAGEGTVILRRRAGSDGLASVASRAGMQVVRLATRSLRREMRLLTRFLGALELDGHEPQLVVGSGASTSIVLPASVDLGAARREVEGLADVALVPDRAIVCIVGQVLAHDARWRVRVLGALAELDPEILVRGASGISVAAVLERSALDQAVLALHRRFIDAPRGSVAG